MTQRLTVYYQTQIYNWHYQKLQSLKLLLSTNPLSLLISTSLTYLIITFDIDIGSLVNKVFSYVNTASFNCQVQGSNLMESKKCKGKPHIGRLIGILDFVCTSGNEDSSNSYKHYPGG